MKKAEFRLDSVNKSIVFENEGWVDKSGVSMWHLVKPGQNKKGQKFFYLHGFINPFLKLAAEKKNSKNGPARKIFGPYYFVTALVYRLA